MFSPHIWFPILTFLSLSHRQSALCFNIHTQAWSPTLKSRVKNITEIVRQYWLYCKYSKAGLSAPCSIPGEDPLKCDCSSTNQVENTEQAEASCCSPLGFPLCSSDFISCSSLPFTYWIWLLWFHKVHSHQKLSNSWSKEIYSLSGKQYPRTWLSPRVKLKRKLFC